MKAKKKPLEETTAAAFGVEAAPRARLLETNRAPQRKAGMHVKTVDELLHKLRDEARII